MPSLMRYLPLRIGARARLLTFRIGDKRGPGNPGLGLGGHSFKAACQVDDNCDRYLAR